MTSIRKFFAVILAALFVISGVTALLAFNMERTVFSADTYKTAFADEGLYQYAPTLMAQAFASRGNDVDGSLALLAAFDQGSVETIIASLLPPEQMEELTNNTLDSLFAFLNGDIDTVTISLVPFKRSMTGEAGMEAFAKIIQTQPDCTADQLVQMGLGVLSSSAETSLCKPPSDMMGLLTPFIETQLQNMANNIPDEWLLVEEGNKRAIAIRTEMDRVRAMMLITPLIPLAFFLGMTLLSVRSLSDWLKWWGIPFMVLGMISAVFAWTGQSFMQALITEAILQQNQDMPFVLANLLQNITESLSHQILRPTATHGVLLVLLGGGMWWWNKYKLQGSNTNRI